MDRSGRTPRRRRLPQRSYLRASLVAAGIFVIVLGLVIPASASHPEVSLPNSDFEIDSDANLVVDDPINGTGRPSLDWATVAESRKSDLPSGTGDNSFVQGTKENTAVPVIESGSIPPNKSDLLTFGVYEESNPDGGFMHLFWTRVQDPRGTTNMDFEFNQSSTPSANGVTPVRTIDDLLITYDLSKGGTHPVLSLRSWRGSVWGPAIDLTALDEATGSINSSAIPAGQSDGLGSLDPRTFGEASIDLSAIFEPDACTSFGSAYLKSRSSDSFTAALKDFIAPESIEVSNCGSVRITKEDDASPPNPLAGAEFTLYVDNDPVGGSGPGPEDTATAQTCTTDATGVCTIDNVLVGNYWVVETVTPAGHDSADPQAITVVADEEVALTFVDPRQRGSILVTKTAKNHDAGGVVPQEGVTFTVLQGGAVVVSGATDANGKVCFDGLLFGDYTVSETVPSGYHGQADKVVTVDSAATCAAPAGGESVSFVNTPLSDISVSFQPQVSGATAAKISCQGLTADPPDGTPGAFDDTSETFTDLEPGTYTCTVEIDP